MNTITTAGMIAAVKAKWPDAHILELSCDKNGQRLYLSSDYTDKSLDLTGISLSEISTWRSAYSRLTSTEKALAVVCPKCASAIGISCRRWEINSVKGYGDFVNCDSHPERIALVSDLPGDKWWRGEKTLVSGCNCPPGFSCSVCEPDNASIAKSEREEVVLPELDRTPTEIELAKKRVEFIFNDASNVRLQKMAFVDCESGYQVRTRQLLSALERVQHLELVNELNLKAHDGWKDRAESAEARVGQLEEAEENRIVTLHKKFGFVPSKDGSKKCACAYCVRDFEAVADHAADLEMSDFSKGERIAVLESAGRELAKLILREREEAGWPNLQKDKTDALSNPIVVEILKLTPKKDGE